MDKLKRYEPESSTICGGEYDCKVYMAEYEDGRFVKLKDVQGLAQPPTSEPSELGICDHEWRSLSEGGIGCKKCELVAEKGKHYNLTIKAQVIEWKGKALFHFIDEDHTSYYIPVMLLKGQWQSPIKEPT